MANKSSNWFLNVAKSLQYGSKDFAGKVSPNMMDTFDNNIGFVQDKFNAVRSSDGKFLNPFDAIKNNTHIGIGKDAVKNAISDIKSGKIYNKERQDAMEADDDDMFGFADFPDGGESQGSSSDAVRASNEVRIAVKQSGSDVRDTVNNQTRSIRAGNDRLVQGNKNNTEAIISSFNKSMAPVNKGVTVMAASMANIEKFQLEHVKNALESTKEYQTKVIDILTEQNEHLKSLASVMTASKKSNDRREESQYDQTFKGGIFSADGYASVLKKNINEAIDGSVLGSARVLFNETDQLKYLAANPIGFIATKAVEKIIPTFVQSTINQIDKSFKEFVPAMFMRMAREGEKRGGIMGTIAKLLGINSSTRGTVNLGKFEKGPIPFDGETKKAITEVIPGYLRKILASIDKKEEISFDMNDGKWKNTKDIIKRFEDDRHMSMMSGSGFSRLESDILEMGNKMVKMSERQMKEFENATRKTLLGQIESGNGINYKNMAEIQNAIKGTSDAQIKNLLSQIIKDGLKDQHMMMSGSGIMRGRSRENEYMENAERNPLATNASIAQNGLYELGKDMNSTVQTVKDMLSTFDPETVKLKSVIGGDKYGLTTTDYVRDIKSILLNGIKVYNAGTMNGSTIVDPNQSMLNDMNHLTTSLNDLIAHKQAEAFRGNFTSEQEKAYSREGYMLLSQINESSDFSGAAKAIRASQLKNQQSDEFKQKQGLVSKFFSRLKEGDSMSRVFKETMDDALRKPSEFLRDRFNKLDRWMYDTVFPDANTDKNRSVFAGMADKMKESFDSIKLYANKNLIDPLKELFVGENSIFGKKTSSSAGKMEGFMDFFLGSRDIYADGTRSARRNDGALSGLMGGVFDAKDAVKHMLTGKSYVDSSGKKHDDSDSALIPTITGFVTSTKQSVSKYLLGDKDAQRDADKKGILTTVNETIQTGARNWTTALFGGSGSSDDKKQKLSVKETLSMVMRKAPKGIAVTGAGMAAGALLASGTGFLGALLIPSTIATMLGGGLGLATQSEKFMTKMFGEKDVNGDRIGGVINRSTVDFFKNNKNVIIGGGALGLAKGLFATGTLGALGTAVLGPVGMAGLGVGAAMAYRSNAVQNILFGKMDVNTGARLGGLLNRAGKEGSVNGKKFKDLIPNVLTGAGAGSLVGGVATYGLMGSLFGPLGVIGGALLGTAGGIALSSDKFKNMLFGKWDEKSGLRDGGVIGKFSNWFTHSVKNPLYVEMQQVKLNMRKWFTKSITDPFKKAIDPMQQAFKNMANKVGDMFKSSWDVIKTSVSGTFERHVGKPFGEFMDTYIKGPLAKVMKAILYTPAKLVGGVISAPFRAAGYVGGKLEEGQKRRGIRKYRKDIREGDDSLFGKIRRSYFDRQAIRDAQYSEEGADYAHPEIRAKQERERAARDKEFEKEQKRIDALKANVDKRSRLAAKYGYENFMTTVDPKTGKERRINLASMLNVSFDKGGKNYREFMKNGSNKEDYKTSIEQSLGVPLQLLLGLDIADDIDPANLSKNQRKAVSRAFSKSKNTIKGNHLLRALGLKGDVRSFDEDRKAAIIAKNNTIKEAENEERKKDVSGNVRDILDNVKSLSDIQTDNSNRIILTLQSGFSGVVDYLSNGASNLKDKFKTGIKVSVPKPEMKIKPKRAKVKTTVKEDNVEPVQGEVVLDRQTTKPKESKVEPTVVTPSNALKVGVASPVVEMILDKVTSIARDVLSISQDTKHQLDGVGSNTYKTRKILQNAFNIKDDDITGSSNRDRLGLWGKIRRGLFKPLEAIKSFAVNWFKEFKEGMMFALNNIILAPIKVVMKGIKAIGAGIKGVLKFTTKTVVGAVKGIGSMVKVAVVDLPKGIIQVAATTAKGIAKASGKILVAAADGVAAVVKGAGNVITGMAKGVGSILTGFGKGVGSILSGVGKAVGSVTSFIGSTVTDMVKAVKPMTTALVKGVGKVGALLVEMPFKIAESTLKISRTVLTSATKFTVSAIRTVGDLAVTIKDGAVKVLKDVGKTVWNFIKAPFQLAGKGIAAIMGTNKPKEVKVVGGYLDSVNCKSCDKDGEKSSEDKVKLITQGSTPSTNITDNRNRKLFNMLQVAWTKKRPLPVYIVNSGGTSSGGVSSRYANGDVTTDANGNGGGSGGSGSGGGGGNPVDGIKAGYKAGKVGVGGAYGAAKGIQGAYGAEKGARASALKEGFSTGYKTINSNGGGKSNVETGVGSMAVGVPGKLTKSLKRSSTFMAGGFTSNAQARGTDNGSFVSRRNINHYLNELAEKQEMEEKAVYRWSVVDLLTKIEWNTRRTAQILEDISNFLPKMAKDLKGALSDGFGLLGRKIDGTNARMDALNDRMKDISDKNEEARDRDDDTDGDDFDGSDGGGGYGDGSGGNGRQLFAPVVRPGKNGGDGRTPMTMVTRGGLTGGKPVAGGGKYVALPMSTGGKTIVAPTSTKGQPTSQGKKQPTSIKSLPAPKAALPGPLLLTGPTGGGGKNTQSNPLGGAIPGTSHSQNESSRKGQASRNETIMRNFDNANSRWHGINGGYSYDPNEPDYEKHGYKTKTAKGKKVGADGMVVDSPTVRERLKNGARDRTARGIIGTGKLLGKGVMGIAGLGGAVGLALLATSLMTDGLDGTIEKGKNMYKQGKDWLTGKYKENVSEENQEKINGGIEKVKGIYDKASGFIGEKTAGVRNWVSDKSTKLKTKWDIAKNSDGKEGMSFEDLLTFVSGDGPNNLRNSKLGNAMINGWDWTKDKFTQGKEKWDEWQENRTGVFAAWDKTKEVWGGLKDHFSDQADVTGKLWEDIKNLDTGALMNDLMDSDLKYVLGAGLATAAYKGFRAHKKRKAAKRLREQDQSAADRERNRYGMDTRTHIRDKARRRTMGETFRDFRRNDFGMSKAGRANMKDERQSRRDIKRQAKKDLRDYDNRMDRAPGQELDTMDLDRRYAMRGLQDHNGYARDQFRGEPIIKNGRITGYRVNKNTDMSVDALRGYGANYRGDTFDGTRAQMADSQRYNSGTRMQKAWNRYAPHNLPGYLRHNQNNENILAHQAQNNGRVLQRKRPIKRMMGVMGAGAMMAAFPMAAPFMLAGGLFKRNKNGQTYGRAMYDGVQNHRAARGMYNDYRDDRNAVYGHSSAPFTERMTGRPDRYDANFQYWNSMRNDIYNDPRTAGFDNNTMRGYQRHAFEYGGRAGDFDNPFNSMTRDEEDRTVRNQMRDEAEGRNGRNRFRNSILWQSSKEYFKNGRADSFKDTYNNIRTQRYADAGLNADDYTMRGRVKGKYNAAKDKFNNISAVKGYKTWKNNRNNMGIVNKGFLGHWADEVKNKRTAKREARNAEAERIGREQEREYQRNRQTYSAPIGPAGANGAMTGSQMHNPYGNPYGGNPYGNPMMGGNPYANPYGNPMMGGNPYGNPYGGNPYGNPMMGGNPYGNPYGGNPYGNPMMGGNQGVIGDYHGNSPRPMTPGQVGDLGDFHGNRNRQSASEGFNDMYDNASRTRDAERSQQGGRRSGRNTQGGRRGAIRTVGRGAGKVAKFGGKTALFGGKLLGKGAGKTLKTVGRIGGMLGKNALRVGGLALGGIGLAAGAAMGYKSGKERAGEMFGLKEGEEASAKQEKAAGIAGGVIGAIPFADMLDEALGGKISKWIAKIAFDSDKIWAKTKDMISDGWDTVKDYVSKPFKAIAKKTSSVWKSLKSSVSDGWEKLKDTVTKPFKAIAKSTSKVWNAVKKTVSSGWNKLKSLVSKPINKIRTSTSKAWNKVKDVVSKAWTKVKSFITKPINKIKSSTSKAWNKVKEVVSKAWTKVKSAVTKPINKVKSATTKVWNAVKNLVTKGWNKIKSGISKVVTTIKEKTTSIFNKVKETIVNNWNKIKEKVSTIVKTVYTNTKEKFEAVKKAVVDNFTKVKTVITDKVKAVYDTAKDKFEAIVSAVKDKFSSIVSTVTTEAKNIVDSIINPIKGIASSISSTFSGLKERALSLFDNVGAGYGAGNTRRYGAGQGNYRYGAGPLDNDGAYFSQNDARWSGKSMAGGGSLTFGDAGCGPTAAAMLVSSVHSGGSGNFGAGYTGLNYNPQWGSGYGGFSNNTKTYKDGTPDEALTMAQRGGFVDAKRGTRDDFFASYGASKNVAVVQKSNPDAEFLRKQLQSGRKMILRGEGGRNFTNAGHYIVATGINESGQVKIKDPISTSRSGMYDLNMVAKNTTDAYVADSMGSRTRRAERAVPVKSIEMDYANGIGEEFDASYLPSAGGIIDTSMLTKEQLEEMNPENLMSGDEGVVGIDPNEAEVSVQNAILDLEDAGEIDTGSGFGKGKYTYTSQQFIAKLATYKGADYVWGAGRKPNSTSYDCSGLVHHANRKLGGSLAIGLDSRAQWRMNKHVHSNFVREGDLVFFSKTPYSTTISHVGVVAKAASGGFYMSHTPNNKVKMETNKLVTPSTWWGARLVGFARIRHMRPGKLVGKWTGRAIYDKYAEKKDTGKIGDKTSTKKDSKTSKTSKKKESKVVSGVKEYTKKVAVTTDPFEKYGLMLTAAATAVLGGKKVNKSLLNKALYKTETYTKAISTKVADKAAKKKKESKKKDTTKTTSGGKGISVYPIKGMRPMQTVIPASVSKGSTPQHIRDMTLGLSMMGEQGRIDTNNYFYAKRSGIVMNGSGLKYTSPDMGIMHWREGTAVDAVNRIYNHNKKNTGLNEFRSLASWSRSSGPWSAAKTARFKKALLFDKKATIDGQNDAAAAKLDSNIKYAVNNGARSYKQIPMIADFANTGQRQSFMSRVGRTTDFGQFYNNMLRSSYWGTRKNIYGNRLQYDYNKLKNWDGGQVGPKSFARGYGAGKGANLNTPKWGAGKGATVSSNRITNIPKVSGISYKPSSVAYGSGRAVDILKRYGAGETLGTTTYKATSTTPSTIKTGSTTNTSVQTTNVTTLGGENVVELLQVIAQNTQEIAVNSRAFTAPSSNGDVTIQRSSASVPTSNTSSSGGLQSALAVAQGRK